jgi:FkbM family methyltransferase
VKQVLARPPGLRPYPFFVHDKDDAFISNRIAKSGVWEPFESTLMLGLLDRSDQFIDVGANIGWYAMAAAARVGAAGLVVAIEPDLDNFAVLEANIGKNAAPVMPVRCALGSAPGRGTMQISCTNKGDQRVRDFTATRDSVEVAGSVRIETLDDVLGQLEGFDIRKLRVIKIDVQGFEAEVLKGAKGLLSELPERAFIFLEFEPLLLKDNSKSACADLIDLIAATRREVFQLCRPIRKLRRCTTDDLLNFAEGGDGSADLVIAHRSQLSALRSTLPLGSRLLSHWQLLPRS